MPNTYSGPLFRAITCIMGHNQDIPALLYKSSNVTLKFIVKSPTIHKMYLCHYRALRTIHYDWNEPLIKIDGSRMNI